MSATITLTGTVFTTPDPTAKTPIDLRYNQSGTPVLNVTCSDSHYRRNGDRFELDERKGNKGHKLLPAHALRRQSRSSSRSPDQSRSAGTGRTIIRHRKTLPSTCGNPSRAGRGQRRRSSSTNSRSSP